MVAKLSNELEFMFMKHYAPNRCEVIMKMGVQLGVGSVFFWGGGGVSVDVNVNEGLKLL